MPSVSVLGFTLTEEDVSRMVGLLRKWQKRPSNPLEGISPQRATLALTNAIAYLLEDRITEGTAEGGKGGWGYSDKEYMRRLYGPEEAGRVHESVMTTVVVVRALYDCLSRMDRAGIQINGRPARDLLDSIVNELNPYLSKRWDTEKGNGGVVALGREGDYTLVPRYRHTAWLFCLWSLLPDHRQKMQKTAVNLLSEFENVKWEREKIATAVAAYSALSLLGESPLCHALSAEAPARVEYLKQVLEGRIESSFSRELVGWASGNVFEGGRQLYTLSVCSEMSCMYSHPQEALTQQMVCALKATMQDWQASDGGGVPLTQGGKGDISASSLAASALMQKPELAVEERKFLSNVVDFLVESLSAGPNRIQGTFSWALSYFVRDISRYFVGDDK